MNIYGPRVDITGVDKPVDNVENPSAAGKKAVEKPVEKVDKNCIEVDKIISVPGASIQLLGRRPPEFCKMAVKADSL